MDQHRETKLKRLFKKEEDELIVRLVQEVGENNWKEVARQLGTRTARQCRERWRYYLSPESRSSPWTAEEDEKLIQMKESIGRKWSVIAECLDNKTGICVRNRWIRLERNNKKNSKKKNNLKKTKIAKEKKVEKKEPKEQAVQPEKSNFNSSFIPSNQTMQINFWDHDVFELIGSSFSAKM